MCGPFLTIGNHNPIACSAMRSSSRPRMGSPGSTAARSPLSSSLQGVATKQRTGHEAKPHREIQVTKDTHHLLESNFSRSDKAMRAMLSTLPTFGPGSGYCRSASYALLSRSVDNSEWSHLRSAQYVPSANLDLAPIFLIERPYKLTSKGIRRTDR